MNLQTGTTAYPAIGHDARTSRSRPARPDSALKCAAAAIIAPLSVHNTGGGTQTGTGERSRSIVRSGPLAATPPDSKIDAAPVDSATRTALRVSTSQTAVWKPAAMSATGASLSLATRPTAVLRPL